MKGMDPVIAVVILIALAIAMSGVLYSWYSSTIQTQQQRTESALGCAFASIEITDVFLSANSGNIVVENTGQRDLAANLVILESKDGIQAFNVNKTIESRAIASLPVQYAGTCANFISATVYTTCPSVSAKFSGKPVCG